MLKIVYNEDDWGAEFTLEITEENTTVEYQMSLDELRSLEGDTHRMFKACGAITEEEYMEKRGLLDDDGR